MPRPDPSGVVNRALVVGVSEYDRVQSEASDGVPGQLPAVRHNRERLTDALVESGLFRADEVVKAAPSQDEFDDRLRRAAHDADGLLLFYFSGHGIVNSAGDELFLQMRNARILRGQADVFPCAAHFTHVLAELAGSRARQVVVVLDCCYAGNAAGIWQNFEHPDRRKIRLLMSSQSNRLTDSGDGSRATPFTRQLVRLLGKYAQEPQQREWWLSDLYGELRTAMARAKYRTADGEVQEPQAAWDPDADLELTRRNAWRPVPRPRPLRLRVLDLLRALLRTLVNWVKGHRRLTAALLALLMAGIGGGLGVTRLAAGGGACSPPLELRVLTDPDLRTTVGAAAAAYLTSPANTTGDGCRRTGITVYSAGTADAVTALAEQTRAWRQPTEDDDPQRDVGPQPDVWIPATGADAGRVTGGQHGDSKVQLTPDHAPFAYSPIVLAVPDGQRGSDEVRTGHPLAGLIQDLVQRDRTAQVLRTDPEYTDTALLATMGLYNGTSNAQDAERLLAQSGPPAPTAADLLCALPDHPESDARTAALVPEFLLRSGVGCDREKRVGRTAEYPDDVPGLEPTFVQVRWKAADRDESARQEAVDRFHHWLTSPDGLKAFGADGFRTAPGDPRLLDPKAAHGVLKTLSPPLREAEQAAMNKVLTEYRGANGPGQVLFLLDSSGSMGALWAGPSGGPGLLKQSLGGLGPKDSYGIWAVYGLTGDGHTPLLPFGKHPDGAAAKVLGDARLTRVHDDQADPHLALVSALDYMAEAGRNDNHPQLIVYLTDDEDNDRLRGRNLTTVLDKAGASDVPVTMVSLAGGGCDAGSPDARISQAGGGRCLDANDDLGPGLHDEVARTGSGEG